MSHRFCCPSCGGSRFSAYEGILSCGTATCAFYCPTHSAWSHCGFKSADECYEWWGWQPEGHVERLEAENRRLKARIAELEGSNATE